MPPCRPTLEMRGASMPDSRATMPSASSEVWRCWVSKSAGTYSASITGVIGSTFRRRTAPFQVCDSVAAVAIAGFARSVSERSIGTRMDLYIRGSPDFAQASTNAKARSVAGCLLQELWADKEHQLAAAERHVVPVVGREVEHRQTRGRKVVGERLTPCSIAAAGEHQRQLL